MAVAFPVVVAVAFLTGRSQAPTRLSPASIGAIGVALVLVGARFLIAGRLPSLRRSERLVGLDEGVTLKQTMRVRMAHEPA